MHKRKYKILGLVSSAAVAVVLAYLGMGLIAHKPASNPLPKTGEKTQAEREARNAESERKHEAAMLAEALKKKPEHTPVLLRLAQISESSGDRQRAAGFLRQVVQNEPDNTQARLDLGRLLFDSGDVMGAIEQTRAILKREPEHADALYNLGAIYANLGNGKEARVYWDRVIALSPKSESAGRARTMLARLPASAP